MQNRINNILQKCLEFKLEGLKRAQQDPVAAMHSREQLSGFPSLYHFFLISMYVCMHLCVCGKLEEGVRSAGIRLRWDYELST